ncbi:hypothetical protein [Falsiroseomonas sp.]|uniref:hypothetical protein n=1 Tax=Falsiroseomonas sp. TaxID=2870721 RepID=UPI003564B4E0
MAQWQVRRIGPIILPGMDARMGANVQGPSMIRVPEWVPGALGRYYLYFADHKGSYIRLAYADAPEGPWRMHEPGSLDLRDSLFPTEPPPPDESRRERLPGNAPPGTAGMLAPEIEASHPHIASPDVHVDHANRRVVMYYHGLVGWDVQRTRVAISADGLSFRARPELLGPSYFRVFRHGGAHYALAMPGILFRSADGLSGFERGPELFNPRQRHTAVLLRGDVLHVFWTQVGDVPERILHSRIPLVGDWRAWRVAGEAEEVLRPEEAWEGAGLPLLPSFRGAVAGPVNQLRDPAVFEEDGRLYLLYAVQGEAGIAIAELLPSG